MLAIVDAASIRETVDKVELENMGTSAEVVLEYGQAPANSNIYKRTNETRLTKHPMLTYNISNLLKRSPCLLTYNQDCLRLPFSEARNPRTLWLRIVGFALILRIFGTD